MITPYWGEFLISPIPLEMSLHYCSHKCAFCFANLNQPGRRADVAAISRLLAEYRQRRSFGARLLQQGYPVVLSNRVDPFAASNTKVSLPLIEVMATLGIPVQIQTRGGAGANEAAALLPPSVWYISISLLDEALRERLEPGAPTIASRFTLMASLAAQGHRVVLGLNPCVPEWLPDPEPLLAQARAAGAEGVWIERLHLNYRQERNLSDREREVLTQPLIDRARKHKSAPADVAAVLRARDAALALGLEVFGVGYERPSQFHAPYRSLYAHTFPTMQDFVNHCHAENWTDRLIPFADFADFFAPRLPAGVLPIDSYLGSAAHNLWWESPPPAQMTFRQLLAYIWSDRRIRFCPARLPCFAFAARWDGEGWYRLVDEAGLPFLVFHPDGFPHYDAHVWFEGEEWESVAAALPVEV